MNNTAGQPVGKRRTNRNGRNRRFIPFYVTDIKTQERIYITSAEAAVINNWLSLKAEEDALQERKEAMKNDIIALVSEKGGSVRFKNFNLINKIRRSYEFKGKTANLKKRFEEAKKADIENQKAVLKSETEYVEVKVAEE